MFLFFGKGGEGILTISGSPKLMLQSFKSGNLLTSTIIPSLYKVAQALIIDSCVEICLSNEI